jgi:hypothetical protein
MSENLIEMVKAELIKLEKSQRMAEFSQWCAMLDATASDMKPVLKDELIADIELRPLRWLAAGLDLLKSQVITAQVALMSGEKGAPISSFLPYPTFQMGTEIFLKGMWLCQFEDCRSVAHSDYVSSTVRKNRSEGLRDLGHDLLRMIQQLRSVKEYQAAPDVLQFLVRVEAVIRQFYFPLYEADKKSREWANSRYPKRFYNDRRKIGKADAFRSYPQQRLIVGLFEPMKHHLDTMWSLRAKLSGR